MVNQFFFQSLSPFLTCFCFCFIRATPLLHPRKEYPFPAYSLRKCEQRDFCRTIGFGGRSCWIELCPYLDHKHFPCEWVGWKTKTIFSLLFSVGESDCKIFMTGLGGMSVVSGFEKSVFWMETKGPKCWLYQVVNCIKFLCRILCKLCRRSGKPARSDIADQPFQLHPTSKCRHVEVDSFETFSWLVKPGFFPRQTPTKDFSFDMTQNLFEMLSTSTKSWLLERRSVCRILEYKVLKIFILAYHFDQSGALPLITLQRQEYSWVYRNSFLGSDPITAGPLHLKNGSSLPFGCARGNIQADFPKKLLGLVFAEDERSSWCKVLLLFLLFVSENVCWLDVGEESSPFASSMEFSYLSISLSLSHARSLSPSSLLSPLSLLSLLSSPLSLSLARSLSFYLFPTHSFYLSVFFFAISLLFSLCLLAPPFLAFSSPFSFCYLLPGPFSLSCPLHALYFF